MKVRNTRMPGEAAAFTSDDAVLQTALEMIMARQRYLEAMSHFDVDEEQAAAARQEAEVWPRYWRKSFRLTDRDVPLVDLCQRRRLTWLEREILMATMLGSLGLFGHAVSTVEQVLDTLGLAVQQAIPALRCLSETGRLYKSGILAYEDADEDLRERTLIVDPNLMDNLIHGGRADVTGWPVKTEEELYDHLARLTGALLKKADALQAIHHGYGPVGDFYKARRRSDRLIEALEKTLSRHPKWKLAELQRETQVGGAPWVMFLCLLGKELGHVDADSDLFHGIGLARAASPTQRGVRSGLRHLSRQRWLLGEDMARPCAGPGETLPDDPEALAETEFELTEKAMETLGLRRTARRRKSTRYESREPKLRLEQLVLTPDTQESLRMALTHTRHADTLLNAWGLGEHFTYGRGVTMLFHGPPGTGKTACAEALAHELGKPLMVANYAEVQNCFVGVTEKNIVSLFREAAQQNALLFWDEADAMFYDRDSATRNWEVRDVNVLLEQIERFEGVCVLATNRKVSLDSALERRIAMKVEFPRPTQSMRRELWRRLVAKKMPLAADVDFDRLASADLSGGEIKNAILNAARRALARDPEGKVTLADFLAATEREVNGKWSEGSAGAIGFGVG